ncbi:hypothetical protein [Aquimarina sp. 2201CG14-23]|uniref:hypothetical protein n=1 Tax=Aquimarina mycalae TaxID=3040073 RepID=UPI002477F984|nr:hypothetical protein [Aquimarina sp. 2201CG14-23]MDH7444677.1 hypothetical protein [Aquimarina sp. 2201CG14-23]
MAAGQFYRGENLRLSFQGDNLYHATSCGLSISTATEELASKDIEGTEISMGNYSGTLSTEALLADKPVAPATYVDPIELAEYQLNKTLLDWEFTTGVAGDKKVSGQCYVTQSDFTAENQQVGTASFSFLVSGDIAIETIV